MYKKMVSIMLIFSLFLGSSCPIFAKEAESDTLGLKSKSAVLMDANTGEILYQKNANKKLPPASVTKIMTILLVMEAINNKQISMNDTVTVSSYAANMGGSQLYMEEGEKRSVEELINAAMIESANDACAALAEFLGGSIESFVSMMNEKAKELKMENTNFKNSNGLPEKEHYTSAKDIALMTRALCQYEEIFSISKTWMKDISIGLNNDKKRTLSNTNKLLKMNSKVDGMKTGYTADAGHCISATGKEGSLRLISVILNAPDSKTRFNEANNLLNYGFNTYKSETIINKGAKIEEIDVNKGMKSNVDLVAKEGIYRLAKKSDNHKYDKKVTLKSKVFSAPLKKGEVLGKVECFDKDNKKIGETDIVVKSDVKKISLWNHIMKNYENFLLF